MGRGWLEGETHLWDSMWDSFGSPLLAHRGPNATLTDTATLRSAGQQAPDPGLGPICCSLPQEPRV